MICENPTENKKPELWDEFKKLLRPASMKHTWHGEILGVDAN